MSALLFGFIITVIATVIVRRIALRYNIVDQPEVAPERKVHTRATPLLGGIAIFVGFFVTVAILSQSSGVVTGVGVLPKYLWGLLIGSSILMIGGYLDDRYRLSPGVQILFPLAATLVIIGSGIGVRFITNPFGGVIRLDTVNVGLFSWHGVTYHLTLWADIFTFVWILGMTYTTKFLDGLDGLVSGITAIGSIIVYVLSVRPPVMQNDTANLAIILAGVCLGFLIFNWHPARIFLGEGGSLLTGFLLGSLAIISGGKIATALLIMGIPILDVAWVIIRRVFIEHRSPFRTSDRKHLHFRLLDVGFSHRGSVVFLYALTAIFGATTLFFHGIQKLIALLCLVAVMVILGIFLVLAVRRRNASSTTL
ncbi:MAG: MraY family glycosyltransferase [Candidatus Kerfeldbacteria bacterium]